MKSQNQVLDAATGLHLFNFMVIGYLIPNQYLFAFCIGIIWEVIELRATRHPRIRSLLETHASSISHLWDETLDNKYFDLLVNMIGYYLGSTLRR
jgi:hypothetical protein